jgi:hypothetical protein
MKKTLTRSILHPKIQWYQFDEQLNKIVLSRQDITEAIDFWKLILGETGFKPNDKLGAMLSLCDIKYFSLLFATLELGGSLCVMDKPSCPHWVSEIRSRIFAPIDIIVTSNTPTDVETAVVNAFAVKQIYSDVWHNYVAKEFSFKDVFNDLPDKPALLGTSSGTTGVPKLLTYTHEFLYNIAKRSVNLLYFEEEDKILHLSNLHHGGSAGIFFFPSLMGSKHHYFEHGLAKNSIEKIIELVLREKINKIMFPNSLLLEEFIFKVPRIEHKLDLYTLQSKNKSWLPHVKRANINSIYSVFGSTEVLGPVFNNIFTINDSPDTFNVLNYGQPLDDFYQICKTDDNKLSITIQNKETYILNDHFNVTSDGDYIFVGRADIIRVNDVNLSILFLENLILKYFKPTTAVLIPDSTTNKLYLLCNPECNNSEFEQKKLKIIKELKEIDNILDINFTLFVPLSQFVDQIKFSYDLSKRYFRREFNLV